MNNLFVFVEGYYDLMFVENILSPFFLKEFSTILYPIPYAQKTKKLINKEIKSKSKHNYVLLADLDSNEHPCITHKKDYLMDYFSNLDSSHIFIVKEEIESWFLAGMDDSLEQFKEFNIPESTDSISKEVFDAMLENNLVLDKESFLLDLSHSYDMDLVLRRNSSLNYFFHRLSS